MSAFGNPSMLSLVLVCLSLAIASWGRWLSTKRLAKTEPRGLKAPVMSLPPRTTSTTPSPTDKGKALPSELIGMLVWQKHR